MSYKNISLVNVYYTSGIEKLPMGRLALKERKIFFEYNPEFLKTGLELSPFKLALKSGVITSGNNLFDGLFGVFNDSLPDGWGRLLLDRSLMKKGINVGSLSPLDRLCYVGNSGMGALVYEPEISGEKAHYHDDLDKIADEVLSFQENDSEQFIEDLLAMNGSSAGARPKILVKLEGGLLAKNNDMSIDQDWIIKFRSSIDPKDIGPIEYAYHLMAQEAKLNVPEAKLFPSRKDAGYFGVKRFDHLDGKKIHMHTVSGLLHTDHRVPSLDYETLMKSTLWLTKDVRECEKQFRASIFNVLIHNRDDHVKNFSFLMDEKGVWTVSPAYDLTYSFGPAGEHCTTIMGEGKNPSIQHFLKLADIVGIKQSKAVEIIDEVRSAVSKWKNFAINAGVTNKSLNEIQSALSNVEVKFAPKKISNNLSEEAIVTKTLTNEDPKEEIAAITEELKVLIKEDLEIERLQKEVRINERRVGETNSLIEDTQRRINMDQNSIREYLGDSLKEEDLAKCEALISQNKYDELEETLLTYLKNKQIKGIKILGIVTAKGEDRLGNVRAARGYISDIRSKKEELVRCQNNIQTYRQKAVEAKDKLSLQLGTIEKRKARITDLMNKLSSIQKPKKMDKKIKEYFNIEDDSGGFKMG